MAALDQALRELYQAPLADFVDVRNRLAAELRGRKERAAAGELGKRRRPTASAWAVNQLYWRERAAFEETLAAAERVRRGDLRATRAYHDRLADLRGRAAAILEDAGRSATDATLRRVSTTLAAIAASGGFAPDPAGALAADRDPPGFAAIGIPSEVSATDGDGGRDRAGRTPERAAAEARREARQRYRPEPGRRLRAPERRAATERDRRKAEDAARREERREAAARRAAERAEEKRAAAEAARRDAERRRLRAALAKASADLAKRERDRSDLAQRIQAAETAVADARAAVSDLERRLAMLDEGGG